MEEYKEELKGLVDLYILVKKWIIDAEELDARLESNVAAIKEMRDALDHVIRFISRYMEGSSDNDREYLVLQIQKAYGHIYRAGYDSLDGVIVSVLARIEEEYLADIPVSSIRDVLPEYWREYRPRLEEIREKASEYRAQKDIGHVNGELFGAYQNDALDALKIGKKIRDAQVGLQDHKLRSEKAERQSKRKDWLVKYIVPLSAAIIGSLLTWLLT
jgi:hypothetical protein